MCALASVQTRHGVEEGEEEEGELVAEQEEVEEVEEVNRVVYRDRAAERRALWGDDDGMIDGGRMEMEVGHVVTGV